MREEDHIGELIAAAMGRMRIVEISFQLDPEQAIDVINYVAKLRDKSTGEKGV